MLCKDKACHRDLGIGKKVGSYISRTGKVMSTFKAVCSSCGKTTTKSYRDSEEENIVSNVASEVLVCPICGKSYHKD